MWTGGKSGRRICGQRTEEAGNLLSHQVLIVVSITHRGVILWLIYTVVLPLFTYRVDRTWNNNKKQWSSHSELLQVLKKLLIFSSSQKSLMFSQLWQPYLIIKKASKDIKYIYRVLQIPRYLETMRNVHPILTTAFWRTLRRQTDIPSYGKQLVSLAFRLACLQLFEPQKSILFTNTASPVCGIFYNKVVIAPHEILRM